MKITISKSTLPIVKIAVAIITIILTVLALDLLSFLYLRKNMVALIDGHYAITKSTVAKQFIEMGEFNNGSLMDITRQIAILRLTEKEAKQKGINISPDELNKRVNEIAQQSGGMDQFTEFLAKNNMSTEEFNSLISNQLMQEKLVKDQIKEPTNEEIEQLYKQYESAFKEQNISKEDAYSMIKDEISKNSQQDALQKLQSDLLKDRVVYYIGNREEKGQIYVYKPLQSLNIMVHTILRMY